MFLPRVVLVALCVGMVIESMAVEVQLFDSTASALIDKMAYINLLIGG